MSMPLIMLGSSYQRMTGTHIQPSNALVGQDANFDAAASDPNYDWSKFTPTSSNVGTVDWTNVLNNIVSTGGDVAKFLSQSNKVAVTPAQKSAVQGAAQAHGITLMEVAPWAIGGVAALVVVLLLVSKKRRK